jgi:hypothetical protein
MLQQTAQYNEEDTVVTEYTCNIVVTTAGDGLWGCEAGRSVQATAITVREETSGYKDIVVMHDSTWDIYSDSAFEAAISAALGYDVGFTEQGMQEDERASMEA